MIPFVVLLVGLVAVWLVARKPDDLTFGYVFAASVIGLLLLGVAAAGRF